MKTSLLLMLLCTVSFLAVCRAETDEFAIFDKDAPPAAQPKSTPAAPTKTAVKPAQSTVSPTPTASVTPTASAAPAVSPVGAVAVSPIAQKIENLKIAIRKDPKNIALIQQLADEFYKNAEYDKATALLWKYVEKIDRGGLLLLARAHEKRNEPDQMIKALNVLTSKDPKDYDAYYLLGNAYQMKDKKKESLENYKTALEINPKFELAYLGLVKLYEKKKNLYEMRQLYEDMVENIGPKADYLSKLCDINTKDGTFEAAIGKCKEAIEKNPNDADSYVNMGLSQKGTGDIPLADKTLKAAADKFSRSEYAQYSFAKVLEDQKNFVDAFTYYKAAASADEKAARAWLGVGTCALELQKLDISLVAFRKACKLEKKYAAQFRKAASQLSGSKNMEWSKRFSEASEQCTYGN